MNYPKKEKTINILFYIAYSLEIFYWMFSNVNSFTYLRVVAIKLAYFLLIVCFIFNMRKNFIKDYIFIGICILISYISMKVSESNSILLIILFLIGMKELKFDKILKFDFFLKIAFIVCVILLYEFGLTENYYMHRADGTVRSSMGFAHPNIFGTYIFLLCCEYVYINYKNMKLYNYIIILLFSLLINYFCDSRTAQIGIVALLILVYLYNKGLVDKILKIKIIASIIKYQFVILTIISYLLGILYINENRSTIQINNMVSNRIKMIATFIEEYDLNLFGNDLELLGTKAASEERRIAKVLDNSYIKIILQYGILVYLILAFLFSKGIGKAQQEKNNILVILLSLFCVYGMMENVLILLQYNVFLLYFSKILYNKKGEENN